MKKKVLELITTLGNGGAETLVKDYSLYIDKNIFNYKLVISFDLPNSVNSKILKQNRIDYEVIYKNRNVFTKVFHKIFGKYYIPRKLLQIIKSEKIEVIHFHLAPNLDYIKRIAKKLKHVKLFFTIHSEPRFYFEDKKIYQNLKYLSDNNDFTIIALHDTMKAEITTKYGFNNVEVLYNGIDVERFESCTTDKAQIRQELGIDNNAFVVGHIGRFNNAKNHVFLIDVFEQILKFKDNALLLLVGNGELYDKIVNLINEKHIADKVIILTNRTDVPKLLKCMDIFVFPSKYEGLPLSVVEAQTMGINCLVADNIPKEVFCNSNVCVKNLSDGALAWAKAINEFNSNIKPIKTKEDFDIKNIVKKLEKLYLN